MGLSPRVVGMYIYEVVRFKLFFERDHVITRANKQLHWYEPSTMLRCRLSARINLLVCHRYSVVVRVVVKVSRKSYKTSTCQYKLQHLAELRRSFSLSE